MSMNQTPQSVRTRIVLFGMTNAGKSSLLNAITNQRVSIVSERAGTTTDPVKKSMELLPLGPVTLVDTAGLDDMSELGRLRIKRSLDELPAADIALLVADSGRAPSPPERDLIARLEGKPLVIAANKSDLPEAASTAWRDEAGRVGARFIEVSAHTGDGIDALKEMLAAMVPEGPQRVLVRDIVKPGEVCVLVVPIDPGAPKGRLILPQQQVIRDLLEGGAMPIVCRDTEYTATLATLREAPALVVTDSQAFEVIAHLTPDDVPLTSFSMLFARFKGELSALTQGIEALATLKDGDPVLISEGCTHHRQCTDIGSQKIPMWLRAHTGTAPDFQFSSGGGFPDDLSPYRLIVHCGACMLTAPQMQERLSRAAEANVPIVNYGVLIAHMNGILERCLAPLDPSAAR